MADDETGDIRLEDMILYLIARQASEQAEDFKLALPKIHEALFAMREALADAGATVWFRQSPVDIYSKQVEAALNRLAPYALPIVNPSFSVFLPKAFASPRLALAEKRLHLPENQLNSLFAGFHDAVKSSA